MQDIPQTQNRLDKVIGRAVDAGFGVFALYLALRITGTYAAVDAFFNAHSGPLLRMFLVFVLLDVVLGFPSAVVKGVLSGLGAGEGLTTLARGAWGLLKRANHPAA